MDTLNRLAVLVNDALNSRGISEVAAANATGIPRSTLKRRLITGDFTLAELERIAPIIETTTEELVTAARAAA
jgi:predicted transcriptional regulator